MNFPISHNMQMQNYIEEDNCIESCLNDGKAVSSSTQDIFQANILGMQKNSLPFIIYGAALPQI